MQHQISPPSTPVQIKLKSPLNVRFDPKFHSARNLSGRGLLSIVDVLNKTADKTVHSQNPGKEAICERGEAGIVFPGSLELSDWKFPQRAPLLVPRTSGANEHYSVVGRLWWIVPHSRDGGGSCSRVSDDETIQEQSFQPGKKLSRRPPTLFAKANLKRCLSKIKETDIVTILILKLTT